MKTMILGILAFSLMCGCIGKEKGRSQEELESLYKTYHAEKNLDGMMSLFFKEGTPEFILNATRENRKDTLKLTITSTEIVPVPEEKKKKALAGFPYGEKTLIVNLDPVNQLDVKFDTSTQGAAKVTGETIMFGKVDNIHYFVLSKFK